jgi:C4-dicarboxylate-specific signal transduction histidine kinase
MEEELNQEVPEETTEITTISMELQPSKEIEISEEVKKLSPVLKIESGLSNFLQNAFNIAVKEQEFHNEIEKEIVSRLPQLKNSELIALATANRTNQNDLFSKLVAPTLQLATARQQNEMAQNQKAENSTNISQTNIHEVNQLAPQEVLVGLKSLFDLTNILKKPEIPVEYETKE